MLWADFDCTLIENRFAQATAPKHMMIGASIFVGYDLILEFLRHHDELN